MRKILTVGLVALAAACGSEDEVQPLRYGAPQAPTLEEQDAAAIAAATLQSALAAPASTQPSAGAAGLADQLAAQLGGGSIRAAASAKLGGAALVRAFDPSACAQVAEAAGVTTVTWTGCHFEDVFTDPDTGDTTSVVVDLAGSLTWTAATGRTAWDIDQATAMVDTATGERVTTSSALDGWTVAGPTGLLAETSSRTAMTIAFPGMPAMSFGFDTTLSADLDLVADPAFCVTGGTLRVEQRAGGAMGASPGQGWSFTWTGCGAFTVAHGG